MDSAKLTPASSGFVLAAAITVLVNTVLACAKDAYAPLKAVMKSIAGHDWTTQGLIDLVLFVGLGLIFMNTIFMNTRVAERLNPNRLCAALIGAVVIAGLGLALWFAFV
jgi:hypothetical protein